MLKTGDLSHRYSKPIIRLSVWSIAIGIAVMILALAIVTGFQREIRSKVIGFGAHIQIKSFNGNNSLETDPVLIDNDFYPELNSEPGVKAIQIYALKPAMLQSQETVKNTAGETEYIREIQGVVTKGIDSHYDWDFFRSNLKEGHLPHINDDSLNNEILISRTIAKRLNIQLHDTIAAFFINNNAPRERKFVVCGIYHTGLEEFDKQFVFIDIKHIRILNNWGVEALCYVRYETSNGKLVVEATGKGSGDYLYDFGHGSSEDNFVLITPHQDTTIRVIVSKSKDYGLTAIDPDQSASVAGEEPGFWIPDTAWLNIRYYPEITAGSSFNLDTFPEVENSGDTHYVYHFPGLNVITKMRTSGGSRKYYAGGFEVLLDNWDELEKADDFIYHHIGPEYQTQTIKDLQPEIFKWLSLLNVNVWVILILMLIVSLINMCSTLLVLILERTNMIGIIKAIGGTNKLLRNTFIWNGIMLIGKGLIYGNILGIGLALIQQKYGFVGIDQNTYFIDTVPINIDFGMILLLNAGTLLLCFATLLLPTWLVSRITPVRAIRFE